MPDKCASCGGAVPSDCIEFNDKLYCDNCWKCNGCKKDLDGEVFDEQENGKTVFYCSEDCIPKAGAASSSVTKAESCDGCKKQFTPKEEFILLKGKDGSTTTLRFHDKCFVCSECNKPIGNQPYGVSHGKPIHADGPCDHI